MRITAGLKYFGVAGRSLNSLNTNPQTMVAEAKAKLQHGAVVDDEQDAIPSRTMQHSLAYYEDPTHTATPKGSDFGRDCRADTAVTAVYTLVLALTREIVHRFSHGRERHGHERWAVLS